MSKTIQLKAIDRCDQCGVQAYIAVAFKAGGELMFCNHHFRESEQKLKALSSSILDESSKLISTH